MESDHRREPSCGGGGGSAARTASQEMVLVLGLLVALTPLGRGAQAPLSPLARGAQAPPPLAWGAQAQPAPPEVQQQQESWLPLVVELEASMQSSVLFELRAAASAIVEGPRPHDAIVEGPRPHNAVAEGLRPHDAIAEGPRPHNIVEGPRPSAERPAAPVPDSSSWATPPVPAVLLGARPGSVPDSSAVLVGQLFSLRIPPRGTNGSCDLTVTSLGKPRLPSFLSWDGERCVLRGVALERDRGAHHLSVSTGGVFSLEVYAEDEERPLVAGGGLLCGEEPLTVLTVILDADLTKMAAAQRVALLRVMVSFASGAAPESLRAAPVVNNRLFDMSAFMAGPGNAKKVVENGALLSWPLGCALDQSTVPDLGAVRGPARDGSMSARLGYPVVGWHVANKKPPPPPNAAGGVRRLRRQLYNTPTPVPSLAPPTAAHPEPPPARLVPTPTSPAIAPLSTDSSATPVRGPLPLPVKPTIRLRDQLGGALGPTPALGPPQPTRVLGGGGATSTLPIQPTVTRPTIVEATALPTPPSTSTRRPNATSTRRPKTTSTRRPTKRPRVKSTTAKPAAPKTTTLTAPPPPAVAPDNRIPEIRNPIDEVNAWVGTYFEVKIPPDTFYDQEDGTADKLRLTLKKTPREAVGEGSWIHFNSTIQLLYGMPDERDTGKHEYFMLATDKGGRSIMDAFEVRVHRWSGGNDKPSALFAARFHGDHKTLLNDVHKKIQLSKRLAYALGDRNASTVSIRSITKGSIVVEWTNNSLTQSVCPKEQITALCNRISDPQGKPKLAFSKAMEPDFKAMNITVLGANLCQRYSFVPPGEVPVVVAGGAAPPAGGGAAGPTPFPVHADGRSTDDVYLHTVIPAVVVAALLLVAGVLAMVCYRKKRKGKMTMEEQATFIKKGVPIIFADELDDSKSPPSSSIPLILQEEKPPLPPPEYPNMLLSGGGGSLMGGPGVGGPLSATLLSADLLEEYSSCYHDDQDDPNAPPYQPPPPFTVPMEGKGSRPKNMTSYRSPPPYVPP